MNNEMIIKNFEQLENLVIQKFGFEHPYTITFFQHTEKIKNDLLSKNNYNFINYFDETYFTEVKNIIINDYQLTTKF